MRSWSVGKALSICRFGLDHISLDRIGLDRTGPGHIHLLSPSAGGLLSAGSNLVG